MWKNKDHGQTKQAETLAGYLDCPCEYFAPAKDDAPVMAAYQQARERGKTEGFVPMLIALDDTFDLFWGASSDAVKAEREKLLRLPLEPGETVLAKRIDGQKEYFAECGENWEDAVTGEMTGGDPVTQFLGYWDHSSKSTYPIVLAEIPVKNPWEIFAWLPFGGWNECPAPEEQMAVAKYWFELYGAVPAVMTQDVLEFALPAPVGREQAMKLALEQYAFCMDIVDQGVGTVGALADGLAQSDKWYFWWD